MADIDNLQITIESSSTQAAQQVDALTAALKRLKTATGSDFSGVAKSIQGVGKAAGTSAGQTGHKAKGAATQGGAGFDAAKVAQQLETVDNQISKTEAKIEAINERLYELKTIDKEFGTSNFSAEIEQLTTKSDELGRVLAALDEQRQSLFSQFSDGQTAFSQGESVQKTVKDIDELIEQIEAVRSALSNISDEDSLSRLEVEIKQVKSAYDSLLKSLSASPDMISEESLAKLSTARDYLNELKAEKKIVEAGIKEQASLGLETDTTEAEQGLDGLTKKSQAFRDALEQINADPITKLAVQIKQTQAEYNDLLKSISTQPDMVNEESLARLAELRKDLADFKAQKKEKELEIKVKESGTREATKKVNALDAALKNIEKSAKNKLKSIGKSVLNYVTSPFTKAIKVVDKWTSSIKRIAFYRLVRSALREITQGFKEGTDNLYQYSNLAGTEFAPAMDSLATSAQYLKNSFGAMAAPLIQAVAPAVDYLINKFVSLINVIGEAIAALTGKSTFTKAKKSATEYGDALESAGGAAKALKDYTLGIDELNVINDDSSSGGGGASAAADYLSMFEEVEVPTGISDWAAEVRAAIEAGDWYGAGAILANKLNEVIAGVPWDEWGTKFGTTIQNGISLALGFINTFDWKNLGASLATFLNNAIDSINPEDVGSLIASKLKIGIEMAYGFVFGNEEKEGFDFEQAGEWLAGVVNGWFDEVPWEDLGKTIAGLFNGCITMATTFLEDLDWEDAKESIKTFLVSFWEELGDKQDIFVGIAAAIGSWKLFGPAIKKGFSGLINSGETKTAIQQATQNVGGISDSAGGKGGGLNSKLTSLAKNMGLVLVVIIEASVAIDLVVGEVWILGKMLEEVGEAWQPVIDNADTVATAMGIGTLGIAAVGAAAAVLGSLGGAGLIVNMGLGIAILAEMSIATDLFLGEIWAIGKLLQEIDKAWQPVIENGDRIAEEIGIGAGLLAGIGVVTAALGYLTMVSGGSLALAIGIGAGILWELSQAFIGFSGNLVDVANELKDRLAPALDDVNGILPDASADMSDFVDFMEEFAGQVGRYTEATAISALDGMIDTVIGWFTKDPIDRMAGEVQKTYNQVLTLNSNLELANPELEKASGLLDEYEGWMTDISTTIEGSSTEFGDVDISTFRDNLKEFGGAISDYYNKIKKVNFSTVDAASDSVKTLADTAGKLKNINTNKMIDFGEAAAKMGKSLSGTNWSKVSGDFVSGFTDMVKSAESSVDGIESSINDLSKATSTMESTVAKSVSNIKSSFSGLGTSISNSLKSAINTANKADWTSIGKNAVSGINKGFNNNSSSITSTVNSGLKNVAGSASNSVYISFQPVGLYILYGIAKGINDNWSTFTSQFNAKLKSLVKSANKTLGIASPSKVFEDETGYWIGAALPIGAGEGIADNMSAFTGSIDNMLTSAQTAASLAIEGSPVVSVDSYQLANYTAPDNNTENSTDISGVTAILGTVVELLQEIADKDITLDGKTITSAVERVQKNRGASIMVGGVY